MAKTHLSIQKLADIANALNLTLQQLISTDPQSVVTLTQSNNSNSINYGTQNNTVDVALLDELRQQLKIKDEHIKFLQAYFTTK